jgi:hypothetical protein
MLFTFLFLPSGSESVITRESIHSPKNLVTPLFQKGSRNGKILQIAEKTIEVYQKTVEGGRNVAHGNAH